jgi:hypothetical protein
MFLSRVDASCHEAQRWLCRRPRDCNNLHKWREPGRKTTGHLLQYTVLPILISIGKLLRDLLFIRGFPQVNRFAEVMTRRIELHRH